jgi:hypothetical protein
MGTSFSWSTPKARLAHGLACAFLAEGPWTEEGMVARGTTVFGEEVRWVRPLARATLKRYAAREHVQLRELAQLLRRIRGLSRAPLWKRPVHLLRVLAPLLAMRSPRWPVPSLLTAGDLAAFLGLDPSELAWLADARGLERLGRGEPLAHYRYAWVKKKTGGHRLLEAPKPRTKELQRRILHELLDRVPPHRAAHGFRRGHSVLTHAAPHAGRALVLRLDLEDFFPSIGAPRVRALFGALGYPEEVAHLLACLCTNVAPVGRMARPALPPYASHGDVRARHDAETRARTRHLPQGAPTSPAIANLCAFRLDVRLTALALKVGASYTRYADDLVFSGDASFQRRSARFAALAAGIAGEEGFVVNHRKTRFMSQAASQRVGGLVVNARPRAPRAEYDALRAILFNAARTGLDAQNRDRHPDFRRHLEGRVAWLSSGDPARATKLQALLQALPRA